MSVVREDVKNARV